MLEGVNMTKKIDKYISNTDEIPKRSEKNKELYKQIYNAYDEFENLIVPSNAKEIDLADLKKEISSRDEYKQIKEVETITNTRIKKIDVEPEQEEQKEEIYDINELLDKAVSTNKKEDTVEPSLSSKDYLKKLKIDNTKTNLEKVKEMYNDIEEDPDNNEELIKTANLSLEILSDLKGNDDTTTVSPQIIDDIDDIISVTQEETNLENELQENTDDLEENEEETDYDFYSNKYKFSKKDFEGKDKEKIKSKEFKKNEEDSDDDEEDEDGEEHSFLKIFFLIFGILLVIAIIVYLIIYFGKN